MDRERKRELRNLNARAWAGDTEVFPVQKSLDSSLKKNTAFIKRLRTSINGATTESFMQDIRSVALQKYLSEVVPASYEGLCKLKTPAEIAAGVEVISGLHQRFGSLEYTSRLAWLLGKGLSTPEKAHLKALPQEMREKEEKERLARQRVLLRVVTELWLVGLLRTLDDAQRPDDVTTKGKDNPVLGASKSSEKPVKMRVDVPSVNNVDAEPFPLEVLKDLLGHDREHVNLPLVVLFVKAFDHDILGVENSARKGRQTVGPDGETTTSQDAEGQFSTDESQENSIDDIPLTTREMQQRFRNVLERYLEDVKKHVVKDQKAIAAQGRKNAEVYVKSGEVFEDRQANFERQCKAQEKLVANTQILCDVLGSEMPDLKDDESADVGASGSIGMVKAGEYLRGQGEGAGIWEDEEERRFYENLIDVKDRVPAVLLEDPKKKKADADEPQVGKKADSSLQEGKDAQEKQEASEDQSTVIANKTVGAQVDALLTRLPELQTKDAVDQLAVDFCFLNSKASRNRLIKAAQDVPKGRSDLLPIYSRLVATLGKHMPDIASAVVSYLDDEFRSLQRRKSKDFLGQVRLGNVRYLAELTKFGVVPEHVIFHCLKVSLDDFSRMNIEIIANLMENCGRYLLRNPNTSHRMRGFLETLQRKKTAQHLAQQDRMLIENAIYYVNPPDRAAIQQKERTPIELFVRRLIYLDMNRRTYAKILKTIRKLHWEEEEVVEILEKVFSKPGKVKYSNIHLLAVLVGALNRYHNDFVVSIIDTILENITLGLEQNDFRANQKRIAEVKYLGELYNYKLIDSPVIFDTLYRLVTFGHVNGTPSPERANPLDLPDDYFRIRLVCIILDTCGNCFDRGAAKKKLDFFLTFLQYYISTKEPMPMDVEFLVQDSYGALRPQWKIAKDFSEAGQLFAEAVAQNYKSEEPEKAAEPEELEEEISSEDADGDDIPAPRDDQQSSSEEVDGEPQVNGQPKPESDFEEDIVVTRPKGEINPEADAEFEREFQKMMAESTEARKFERKPFDVPLPLRKAQREPIAIAEDSPIDGGSSQQPSTMAFSLMTKKGNRPQTRTIDLPLDSNFAIAMQSKKEAERAEQQRIKDLVLNYDLQNMADSDGTGTEKQSYANTSSNHHHHHSMGGSSSTGGGSGGSGKASDKSSTHHHGSHRGGKGTQQARKLQLSDVNWYGNPRHDDASKKHSSGHPNSRRKH